MWLWLTPGAGGAVNELALCGLHQPVGHECALLLSKHTYLFLSGDGMSSYKL